MKLIKCPECGYELSPRARQCVHCGYLIESVTCLDCGGTYPAFINQCPHCGFDPVQAKEEQEKREEELRIAREQELEEKKKKRAGQKAKALFITKKILIVLACAGVLTLIIWGCVVWYKTSKYNKEIAMAETAWQEKKFDEVFQRCQKAATYNSQKAIAIKNAYRRKYRQIEDGYSNLNDTMQIFLSMDKGLFNQASSEYLKKLEAAMPFNRITQEYVKQRKEQLDNGSFVQEDPNYEAKADKLMKKGEFREAQMCYILAEAVKGGNVDLTEKIKNARLLSEAHDLAIHCVQDKQFSRAIEEYQKIFAKTKLSAFNDTIKHCKQLRKNYWVKEVMQSNVRVEHRLDGNTYIVSYPSCFYNSVLYTGLKFEENIYSTYDSWDSYVNQLSYRHSEDVCYRTDGTYVCRKKYVDDNGKWHIRYEQYVHIDEYEDYYYYGRRNCVVIGHWKLSTNQSECSNEIAAFYEEFFELFLKYGVVFTQESVD